MATETKARRFTSGTQIGWYLVLSALSLLVLFPIWMTLVRAISDPFLYIEEGQPFYPVAIDREVFSTAWSDGDLGRSMLLTLAVTVVITLAQLVTSVLAAYSFAFLRYPFKNVLFVVVIASLLLPIEVTLVANVRTIRELSWLDSIAGLSAPFVASAFGIFLIRQGFLGMPSELREAARLDGYGHAGFLWRVAIPMNRAIIGSFTLIAALTALEPVPVAPGRDHQGELGDRPGGPQEHHGPEPRALQRWRRGRARSPRSRSSSS